MYVRRGLAWAWSLVVGICREGTQSKCCGGWGSIVGNSWIIVSKAYSSLTGQRNWRGGKELEGSIVGLARGLASYTRLLSIFIRVLWQWVELQKYERFGVSS